MGIISATGRNQLGLNTYEDFIQTDAAINPGNSGGALVDAAGNLVGINTAIFSKSGGSQGIGFAIPTAGPGGHAVDHRARPGDPRLARRRGQGADPELAESLGLGETAGIVVAGVYRDGPAARGGLLPGDVILTIDKQEASDGRRSMNQVARTRPGQKISIEVLRNGQKVNLTAEVASAAGTGSTAETGRRRVIPAIENERPRAPFSYH